jgi:hypothetical protein
MPILFRSGGTGTSVLASSAMPAVFQRDSALAALLDLRSKIAAKTR